MRMSEACGSGAKGQVSNRDRSLQLVEFVLPTAPSSPEAAARAPELPRDGPSCPEVHFYGQQQQKPPQLLTNMPLVQVK